MSPTLPTNQLLTIQKRKTNVNHPLKTETLHQIYVHLIENSYFHDENFAQYIRELFIWCEAEAYNTWYVDLFRHMLGARFHAQ